MLDTETLVLLQDALSELDAGFSLPEVGATHDVQRIGETLRAVARRMHDNFPYPHPLYAGQMLKPPHPVARLAYALAMWINPNNHALDGGRASSAMEKESVAALARIFGFEQHLGHLASGGTMANLEALWVSGRTHPGKTILASSQAHYTHSRISEVLQLPFDTVPADCQGRMDLTTLENRLGKGDVGTVVATIGTTGAGAVDPLPGILELAKSRGVRIHADAAYGGYFTLAGNLAPGTRASLDCLDQVDSIVIDPHKHGLQPYGCGCVLFQDPGVGRFYKHDSPYTYFSSDELHLGEISLECSRPGASAVALWATQRLLPMVPGGEFAQGLERCRDAALALYGRLSQDERFLTLFEPELDIILWAPRAPAASEISELARKQFADAARHDLHLALVTLPTDLLRPYWNDVQFDRDSVTCLRSCLMKPEHLDWVERIYELLVGTLA